MSVFARRPARRRRAVAVLALLTATSFVAAACGGGDEGSGDGDQVTITLAGPNQWNNNPTSFGPAWEDLVARFEKKEPGINVETNVLPVAEFGQTLSTQLTAGTAPELIFNQVPHTAEQVYPLTKHLEEPNPYVKGNKKWIDIFAQDYFGPQGARGRNPVGDYEWIPFNLVIVGLYYNDDILSKAGVEAPIKTYGDFLNACSSIKKAGYTPLAMDQGNLGPGWTMNILAAMLLKKYADGWNQFDAANKPGKALQVTNKSMAKAILTGEIDATKTPEVAEIMRILKQIFDECATENWSGISGGAAFIGNDDFLGGRAAMSYGTNFAAGSLKDVKWKWGTMPFPTVTPEDSKFSAGVPAQFGAAAGGTSYMIPATVKGEKLEAAIKFLQFASSPEGGQPWLDGSGGIPATVDAKPAPGLEGLMSGDWFVTPKIQAFNWKPKAKTTTSTVDGFLLGETPQDEQLKQMQADWVAWAKESAAEGGWKEDWVKR